MAKKISLFSLVLFAILLTALLIRYRGITFGFPLIVHPDEPVIMYPALNTLRTGDLNPHNFLYPSLYFYMQTFVSMAVFAIGKLSGVFKTLSDVPLTAFFYWGRMLTILLSAATIFLTFTIGRLLFSRKIGLIAAVFIGASYLAIENSFTITTDTPMAFWVLLALLTSVVHYGKGQRLKYYLLNGVCVGLATGTKYTAIWCILPMLYVHLCHTSFSLRKMADKRLLLGLLAVPVTFLLTTPFSLLDHATFMAFLRHQKNAYSLGHPGHESLVTSFGFYGKSLMRKYGAFPLFVGGFGVLFAWLHDRKKTVLLVLFPLCYFLFFGVYKAQFDRNLVCVIPFLSLLTACGVCGVIDLLTHAAHRRWIKFTISAPLIAVVIAVMVHSIYAQSSAALGYIHRITLPDTRMIAKVWVEENLPRGAAIGREHYTPPIDGKKFRVTYLGYFGLIKRRIDAFDYVIASGSDYSRFVRNPRRYPEEAKRYEKIFSKYRLVKEFTPDNEKIGGPVIRIYRIR